MPRRTPETLADYLVVAICPALIMVLVGSLLYFLVEVFYQGEFQLRLLWVLAMFVLGIVCLARLSMEEGYAYASMYSAPLGILVGIALSRFVHFGGPLAPFSLLVNWALMGWVWWCAHQLTWDCTLIDDSEDASGEGLLQQMGLDQETGAPGPEATTSAQPFGSAGATSTSGTAGNSKDWWQKWIEPDRRPHPPGVWVVYFSLGALPMFGIGGRFISVENLDSRRWCFWMLVLYVASAMALLLATSFLGLRKYLRQRRLEMPLDMTATWVVAGTVLIVATIVVASLLPRPSPEYSIAQVIQVDSLEQWASRWGIGPEGGKSKPDQPSSSGTEQQEGQKADQQGGGKADPRNKSGATKQGDKGSGAIEREKRQVAAGPVAGEPIQVRLIAIEFTQQSPGNSDQGKGNENQNNQSQSDQSQSDQNQSDSSHSGDDKNKSDQSRQSSENRQKSDEQAAQNSAESQNKSSEAENKSQRDQSQSSQPQSSVPVSQSSQQSQSSQSQSSQSQPNESTESSPNSNPQSPQIFRYLQAALESLGGLLKAMFYLALAIVAAVLAWRYRAELLAAWKKLLAELAALWPGLFGKRQPEPASETSAPASPRPFALFSDPFASGAAARMSPAEVVALYVCRAGSLGARERLPARCRADAARIRGGDWRARLVARARRRSSPSCMPAWPMRLRRRFVRASSRCGPCGAR